MTISFFFFFAFFFLMKKKTFPKKVYIIGRTHRNRNLPDSKIVIGMEIVFVETTADDMYRLGRMVEYIRRESNLLLVFNLAKVI